MSVTSRSLAALVLSGVLLGAAACGGSSPKASEKVSSSPTPSTSASASPTSAATSLASFAPSENWVTIADKSGISFQFPGKVTPQTRAIATGDEARLYGAQFGGVGVAVTVYPTKDATAGYAKAIITQIAASLQSVGGVDAKASELKTTKLGKAEATDGLITFTATTGEKMYWRIRVISTDSLVVQAQALPGDEGKKNPDHDAIDAAFAKLTASILLP